MAYRAHTLVAIGGTLTDPTDNEKEIWQCTVRGCDPETDFNGPVVDPVAYMNAIAAPLAAWFVDSTNLMANYASLDYLKVNSIGPDGKYSDAGVTNQHDYPDGTRGTASPIHPFTESFCYSWTTPKKRGPGSRGRVYLPNCTLGAAAAATITPAQQAAYLLSAQNFYQVLANTVSPTVEMVPVVASRVNATNTPITGIRIGRVVDSQRRRRNALTEAYVAGGTG